MRAQARAFVAHRIPTRIRIKLANARGRGAELAKLKQVLREHADVLEVQLNPRTGSLIIECRKGFELTARHRRLLGLVSEPRGAGPPRGSGARTPDHDVGGLSARLMLSGLFKLVVAISTRRIEAQLVEWLLDRLIRAATSEVHRRAWPASRST